MHLGGFHNVRLSTYLAVKVGRKELFDDNSPAPGHDFFPLIDAQVSEIDTFFSNNILITLSKIE